MTPIAACEAPVMRWQAVSSRITAAAEAAGRAPSAVQLLAVSKFQPSAAIREIFAAGQRDFGENYVQEALAKMADRPG